MVTGRSATALATWLAAQPADFAAGVEVVAMDGFAGYKTAATNVVPDAVTVMDPFHVVALAGAKLDLIRQRVQQQTLARRGHSGDPLYGIRRIARTRIQLLSARQDNRLTSVLDADEHIAVKVAYVIYQKIIAAYADSNRRRGKHVMTRLIDSIRRGVPVGLEEIAQLGRTLWRRRGDILAFFDHHVSNGPTEAINGRLEALRRNALGFRNITHLSNPFTAAQRRTPRTRQCTLNSEGPVMALVSGVFWACIGDLFGVGDDDDLTDEGVFHGGVKEKIGDVCAGC
jgi:transposase